jgi:hypothetical protein
MIYYFDVFIEFKTQFFYLYLLFCCEYLLRKTTKKFNFQIYNIYLIGLNDFN